MQEFDRQSFFSGAAKWGLVFAAASICYDLVMAGVTRLSDPSSGWTVVLNLLSFLLWAAKLTGLIILMRTVMEKYFTAAGSPYYGSRLFGYGMLISVLSGIVYAGVNLVINMYVTPDTGLEAVNAMREVYAEMGMLSPQVDQALTSVGNNYPSMMFFSQLLYFTIWGLPVCGIISSILRKRQFLDGND